MKNLLRSLICSFSALIVASVCSVKASNTHVSAAADYTGGRILAVNDDGMRYSGCGLLGLSDYLLGKTVPTEQSYRRFMQNDDDTVDILDLIKLKSKLISSSQTPVSVSHFGSTFIEAWLANDYSEEQWQTTINEWKALGITSVIIGDTVLRETNGYFNTFYKSELVNSPENVSMGGRMHYDSVDKILSHCQNAGIKCFVSLGMDSDFWNVNICRHDMLNADGSYAKYGKGQEAFYKMMSDLIPYTHEIYDTYAEKYPDAFYGWYFSPEISNSADFDNDDSRAIGVDTLSYVLNMFINEINKMDPDMPLMLSPYVNIKKEATWCTHSSAVNGLFWEDVMRKTDFRMGDILAPQDSVGATGMTLENLAEWTKAYRIAVDNASKGMKLWSNAESFRFYIDLPERKWAELTQSSFVSTLIQQLELAEPYVDNFTSCSLSTYYNSVSVGKGFLNSYIHYINYGVPDMTPPEIPDTFDVSTINLSGLSSPVMKLSFTGASDNFGIARAEIYKNGKFFTYRVATRWQTWENNVNTGISEPNLFFDSDFDIFNDSQVYEIVLYDCTGNASENIFIKVTAENGILNAEEIFK